MLLRVHDRQLARERERDGLDVDLGDEVHAALVGERLRDLGLVGDVGGDDEIRQRLPALAHGIEEAGQPLRRDDAAPDQDFAEILLRNCAHRFTPRDRRRAASALPAAGVDPVPAAAGLDVGRHARRRGDRLFARHPCAATSAEARQRDRLARSVLLHRLGARSASSRAFSSCSFSVWRMSSTRPLARLKSCGGCHFAVSLKTK